MSAPTHAPDGRLLFTKEMKRDYTILMPMILPIHQVLFEPLFKRHGYNIELLRTTHPQIVTEGLTHVHNDTCYPALLVIGQLIDALKSGKYDINRTALLITQTGGGCRASNYIHLLRKALRRNGMAHVPVVSLNVSGMEKNPGFSLTASLLEELVNAILLGDLLMMASNQTRPYELHAGDTDACLSRWIHKLGSKPMRLLNFKRASRAIMLDFAAIPVDRSSPKIKVGIVGEIYVKYAPLGNNELESFLHGEGVEVVVPPMLGFIMFMCDHYVEEARAYGMKKKKGVLSAVLLKLLTGMEKQMLSALSSTPGFWAPGTFADMKKLIFGYVSPCNKMGEGWLLTAEMLELVHNGVPNVICTQPFGCLPNHIVGKGMLRRIRLNHPEANIVAIDYDPGATRINQENRIKLMLSNAGAQHHPPYAAADGEASTPVGAVLQPETAFVP